MKKFFIILTLITFNINFAFCYETGVLIFDNKTNNENELIKIENMNKAPQVEQAIKKDPNRVPVRVNRKLINQQRALDYTTQQLNSMQLPFDVGF